MNVSRKVGALLTAFSLGVTGPMASTKVFSEYAQNDSMFEQNFDSLDVIFQHICH